MARNNLDWRPWLALGLVMVFTTLFLARDEKRERRQPEMVIARSRGRHRMVEEEVEEGDRLMLWERQEILERERKEKEEEEMARYSETNSERKRQSESDPSKAVELSSLVERLARVAALPPPVPPSSSCAPPTTPPAPTCVGHTGLLGPRRKSPRKLVMMILFAFEVDILEIMLRDSLDLLDHLFIVEAEKTHKGKPKPLMWSKIKQDERFRFANLSKVEEVVVRADQVDEVGVTEDIWYMEDLQTRLGLDQTLIQVKRWAIEEDLAEDDLFISANVDEVMSRSALQLLRWCDPVDSIISGALWMPLGDLNRALRSDFPVHGRPHTFGLPTIYKWGAVASGKLDGSRLQVKFPMVNLGPRDKYVLGGLHLTHSSFLPTALLKEVSATEAQGWLSTDWLSTATIEQLNKEQEALFTLENKPFWRDASDPIQNATDVEKYIPWWLQCNPERYPYWFGKPDPRNKDLLLEFQNNI